MIYPRIIRGRGHHTCKTTNWILNRWKRFLIWEVSVSVWRIFKTIAVLPKCPLRHLLKYLWTWHGMTWPAVIEMAEKGDLLACSICGSPSWLDFNVYVRMYWCLGSVRKRQRTGERVEKTDEMRCAVASPWWRPGSRCSLALKRVLIYLSPGAVQPAACI